MDELKIRSLLVNAERVLRFGPPFAEILEANIYAGEYAHSMQRMDNVLARAQRKGPGFQKQKSRRDVESFLDQLSRDLHGKSGDRNKKQG
jgi:hypothetical protein